MNQTLFIVGVNHRTAPVAVRERLAFEEDEVAAALRRLKKAANAVQEAALLSTCNRVEIVAVANDSKTAGDEVVSFLASDRGVAPELFRDSIYTLDARQAARHLFRVSASLDSMVVGEPQ